MEEELSLLNLALQSFGLTTGSEEAKEKEELPEGQMPTPSLQEVRAIKARKRERARSGESFEESMRAVFGPELETEGLAWLGKLQEYEAKYDVPYPSPAMQPQALAFRPE